MAHDEETRDEIARQLASGISVSLISTDTGVSRSVIYGWRKDAAFAEAVTAYRRLSLTESAGRITAKAPRAIERLAELSESEDERVAIAACKALLSHLPEVLEVSGNLEDIEVCLNKIQELRDAGLVE